MQFVILLQLALLYVFEVLIVLFEVRKHLRKLFINSLKLFLDECTQKFVLAGHFCLLLRSLWQNPTGHM